MRWIAAGVLALVLGACTFSAAQKSQAGLAIRSFPEGRILGQYPLTTEQRFALSFIHSVSATPVRDEYRLQEGKILQTAEIFEAHGAGLPSSDLESGATGWEQHGGRFILHLQRPIPQLVVRTDACYRNRLHLGENVIDLNQWADQALEIVPVVTSGR